MLVTELITPFRKAMSKIDALPVLSRLSPSAVRAHSTDDLSGYAASQSLSLQCAQEVAKLIQPGWTEIEAARAMEIWLRDHGVKSFFHKPFVWWGNRTRFDGVKTYWDYQPTARRLLEGEVFILDVAPIVGGYICDIGFSGVIGENKDFDKGRDFLVSELRDGQSVWRAIDQKIKLAGYENIHAKYPFGVLGHRVHKAKTLVDLSFLHFGWQSYWEFTSRGLFGQLLDSSHVGRMEGVWAIEPHIGGSSFGMKFEEILVVDSEGARWLQADTAWSMKKHESNPKSRGP